MLIAQRANARLTREFSPVRLLLGAVDLGGKAVKIFAYRIVQKGPRTFETIIERLNGLSLADRTIGGSKIRLEERARRRGLLFVDFARQRGGHGPGRMAPNEALQDIPLRGGQNFGEDTGLAYDPASGCAAVQYNHYGPRAPSIEHYLYDCDLSFGGLRAAARPDEPDSERCGFQFGAFLKQDAYERLQKFGVIHEIDFTIALPGVNRHDLEAGRSLGDVLRAPLPEGVESLSMHIKAAPGRRGALGRDGAFGIIDHLQRLGGDVKRAFGERPRAKISDLKVLIWSKRECRSIRGSLLAMDSAIRVMIVGVL